MTLQNFPDHFTHTITTEVHASADGHATHIIIRNFGGILLSALKDIGHEALQSWQGSASPRHLLLSEDQTEDDVRTFMVHTATSFRAATS